MHCLQAVTASSGPLRLGLSALVAIVVSCPSCGDHAAPSIRADPGPKPRLVAASPAPEPGPGPVVMEEMAVTGDLPAYVLRGAREHRMRVVFLPGACVHPLGYAQAFQHTAASRGDMVALQGDVACTADGTMRRWSNDLEAMSRRIDAAFRAAGLGDEARDVTLVGYSQGAERAERLAERWPAKYTTAVLMSGPVLPSGARLGRLRAAVLMAGDREGGGNMREGARELVRGGVPAMFVPIPGASHGQMGREPEETMGQALDFIERTLSVSPSRGRAVTRGARER